MITLFGIPNCNSTKKATDWLEEHEVAYEFHDYKKKGVTGIKLKEWCIKFGWAEVLNKAGSTWRTLSNDEKSLIKNEKTAIEFMQVNTSAIKRPIIEGDDIYMIGFDEEKYKEVLLP